MMEKAMINPIAIDGDITEIQELIYKADLIMQDVLMDYFNEKERDVEDPQVALAMELHDKRIYGIKADAVMDYLSKLKERADSLYMKVLPDEETASPY